MLLRAQTPSIFNLVPLLSQRVLFNGRGGNRARTRQPMADRLEIIHEIASRAAATESGGEVRLDDVMLAPRVSLTFDGPVSARHCSRKRWGSLSSIGVRYFFSFFCHLFLFSFSALSFSSSSRTSLTYPRPSRTSRSPYFTLESSLSKSKYTWKSKLLYRYLPNSIISRYKLGIFW